MVFLLIARDSSRVKLLYCNNQATIPKSRCLLRFSSCNTPDGPRDIGETLNTFVSLHELEEPRLIINSALRRRVASRLVAPEPQNEGGKLGLHIFRRPIARIRVHNP